MAFSRRTANLVISAFLLLQSGLLARAALPLPKPLKGGWPWRMFDRRAVWEKRLEADGLTSDGAPLRIPLEELFTYRRGFTPLRAYDQVPALNDKKAVALHQDFALYLVRRMKSRGVVLREVTLRWHRSQLLTGEEKRDVIGRFRVDADAMTAEPLKVPPATAQDSKQSSSEEDKNGD